MKKIFSFIFLFILFQLATTLVVEAQTRTYHTNKAISGVTEDAQGTNYMLLHKVYNGTNIPDSYVQGKITGIRGTTLAYNRKWTVEVNTSSARDQTRGSILCYNEGATLVTLTYNSERYMAVTIANSYQMNSFSFTGYAQNETLIIAYDEAVSNVLPFTGLDAITIQGNVGIGTTTPSEKLEVVGSVGNIQLTSSGARISFTRNSANYIDAITAGGYLIFSTNGAQERMRIDADGNIGIGTSQPGIHKLAVEGSIGARRVKVTQGTWSDFVFHPDYKLPALSEVEKFIKENQHLPEIPSAAEVQKEGLDLGEMNKKLLQKVEELTLYLIDIKKELNELKQRNETLEKKITESNRH